ncbi:beta strand repeat-containing protein, partial [Bacteroidota bacterium]
SDTYNNLTIDGSGIKTAAGDITVSKTLTINSGCTLADDGNTITANGNISNDGTHSGTGLIELTGGSAQHTLSGTGAYQDLELDDANGAALSNSFSVNGNLTITAGTFGIGTQTVTVTGATDISSTVSIGTGILDCNGSFDASGIVDFTGAGLLRLGSTSNTISGSLDDAAGTVVYDGDNAQDILADTYFNLQISSANAQNKNAAGAIDVDGAFTINAGATFGIGNNTVIVTGASVIDSAITINNGTLTLNGDFTGSGSTISFTGAGTLNLNNTITSGWTTLNEGTDGTIVYGRTDVQTVISDTYNNLTIDGSGIKTAAGAITVSDTLTINAGTLNIAGNDLDVGIDIQGAGNLTSSGGDITVGRNWSISNFTHGSNTVTCNGSSTQNISSTTTFYALILNNSNNITLSQDISVNDTLTLTDGLFILGSNNLTLGVNAGIKGSPSASNMVVPEGSGELRKTFNSSNTPSFTFPVGDNTGTTEYSPVIIYFSDKTDSEGYVGVSLTDDIHANNYSVTSSTPDHLSRYWNITQNSLSNYTYNDTCYYLQADVVGDESVIRGSYWDGSSWTALNSANTTDNYISGTGLTSFGDFTGVEGTAPYLDPDVMTFYDENPERVVFRLSEGITDTASLVSNFSINNSGNMGSAVYDGADSTITLISGGSDGDWQNGDTITFTEGNVKDSVGNLLASTKKAITAGPQIEKGWMSPDGDNDYIVIKFNKDCYGGPSWGDRELKKGDFRITNFNANGGTNVWPVLKDTII